MILHTAYVRHGAEKCSVWQKRKEHMCEVDLISGLYAIYIYSNMIAL